MIDIDSELLSQLISTASILAIPLTTGLVEAIKRAFDIPPRFIPLAALALAEAIAITMAGITPTAALAGLVFGLGSVGLWEFGKGTIAGK